MSKRQQAASILDRTGGLRLLDLGWGAQRITVLGHHRITDPGAPDFFGDQTLVSATPAMFNWQLDYISAHYTIIDLQACHDFIMQGKPLPPRPLLITFDDGYIDNYTTAYPMLKERGLPAVIFLATSRMDDPSPLWWDRVAYYFQAAQRTQADLPLAGTADLSTPERKRQHRLALLARLKQIPEVEKLDVLEQLPAAMGVQLPPDLPPQFASWEQVREMVGDGIACQPHTHTHPILSRLTPEALRYELQESRDRILAETDQTLLGMAYTNGGIGDYTDDTRSMLQELGYPLAFSLLPGPVRPGTARQHRYEIPRVYLNWRDSQEIFKTKLLGLPILQQRQRFQLS